MALKKIGALWKKKAKETGLSYLGGSVEFIAGQKVYVKVMPYTVKEGMEKTANSPDYNILLDTNDAKTDKKETKDTKKSEEDFD